MNNKTEIEVQLICDTCGDTANFECNIDKSSIKCLTCGREYCGGYDELVDYNKQRIQEKLHSEAKKKLDAKLSKMAREFNQKNKFVKMEYKK